MDEKYSIQCLKGSFARLYGNKVYTSGTYLAMCTLPIVVGI